ncbi:MAG: NifB/NifX family molybdenum-iron cluster-binding protein [Candidatus Omnitrophica bacterium]|nr:NifB/NifX family molybdenum-iron cluster-binding protein [Candidatus Omnitrophota bacterium]
MKICITAQGDQLTAEMDPRFGRCQYFLIVDTKSGDCEAVANPYLEGTGGVGVQAGQLMAEKKVEVVLTGQIGPNAFGTLQAGGIQVITGLTGKVSEALEKFKRGGLKPDQGPSASSKSGMRGF